MIIITLFFFIVKSNLKKDCFCKNGADISLERLQIDFLTENLRTVEALLDGFIANYNSISKSTNVDMYYLPIINLVGQGMTNRLVQEQTVPSYYYEVKNFLNGPMIVKNKKNILYFKNLFEVKRMYSMGHMNFYVYFHARKIGGNVIWDVTWSTAERKTLNDDKDTDEINNKYNTGSEAVKKHLGLATSNISQWNNMYNGHIAPQSHKYIFHYLSAAQLQFEFCANFELFLNQILSRYFLQTKLAPMLSNYRTITINDFLLDNNNCKSIHRFYNIWVPVTMVHVNRQNLIQTIKTKEDMQMIKTSKLIYESVNEYKKMLIANKAFETANQKTLNSHKSTSQDIKSKINPYTKPSVDVQQQHHFYNNYRKIRDYNDKELNHKIGVDRNDHNIHPKKEIINPVRDIDKKNAENAYNHPNFTPFFDFHYNQGYSAPMRDIQEEEQIAKTKRDYAKVENASIESDGNNVRHNIKLPDLLNKALKKPIVTDPIQKIQLPPIKPSEPLINQPKQPNTNKQDEDSYFTKAFNFIKDWPNGMGIYPNPDDYNLKSNDYESDMILSRLPKTRDKKKQLVSDMTFEKTKPDIPNKMINIGDNDQQKHQIQPKPKFAILVKPNKHITPNFSDDLKRDSDVGNIDIMSPLTQKNDKLKVRLNPVQYPTINAYNSAVVSPDTHPSQMFKTKMNQHLYPVIGSISDTISSLDIHNTDITNDDKRMPDIRADSEYTAFNARDTDNYLDTQSNNTSDEVNSHNDNSVLNISNLVIGKSIISLSNVDVKHDLLSDFVNTIVNDKSIDDPEITPFVVINETQLDDDIVVDSKLQKLLNTNSHNNESDVKVALMVSDAEFVEKTPGKHSIVIELKDSDNDYTSIENESKQITLIDSKSITNSHSIYKPALGLYDYLSPSKHQLNSHMTHTTNDVHIDLDNTQHDNTPLVCDGESCSKVDEVLDHMRNHILNIKHDSNTPKLLKHSLSLVDIEHTPDTDVQIKISSPPVLTPTATTLQSMNYMFENTSDENELFSVISPIKREYFEEKTNDKSMMDELDLNISVFESNEPTGVKLNDEFIDNLDTSYDWILENDQHSNGDNTHSNKQSILRPVSNTINVNVDEDNVTVSPIKGIHHISLEKNGSHDDQTDTKLYQTSQNTSTSKVCLQNDVIQQIADQISHEGDSYVAKVKSMKSEIEDEFNLLENDVLALRSSMDKSTILNDDIQQVNIKNDAEHIHNAQKNGESSLELNNQQKESESPHKTSIREYPLESSNHPSHTKSNSPTNDHVMSNESNKISDKVESEPTTSIDQLKNDDSDDSFLSNFNVHNPVKAFNRNHIDILKDLMKINNDKFIVISNQSKKVIFDGRNSNAFMDYRQVNHKGNPLLKHQLNSKSDYKQYRGDFINRTRFIQSIIENINKFAVFEKIDPSQVYVIVYDDLTIQFPNPQMAKDLLVYVLVDNPYVQLKAKIEETVEKNGVHIKAVLQYHSDEKKLVIEIQNRDELTTVPESIFQQAIKMHVDRFKTENPNAPVDQIEEVKIQKKI